MVKTIIAECELEVNRPINARIYFGGNANGLIPTHIPLNDTFTFTLGLTNVDAAFKFRQEENNPYNYIIRPEDLKIENGKSYRFTGSGDFTTLFSEIVRIPEPISIDSINISKIITSPTDRHFYNCTVQIEGNPRQFEFIQILVEGLNGEEIEYTFEENFNSYKNLKHKNGFLVNNKELLSNRFSFLIAVPKDYNHKQVNIKVGHATDAYYFHNAYLTDNISSQINSQNPPIYPMNIDTPFGRGIFSAITMNSQVVEIE